MTEISVSQQQGAVPVTVLHVKGDIDMTTAEQVEKRAREAIGAGARNLLVDLTDVPYMSSAGLRMLHALFERLRGDSPGESSDAIRQGLADGTFKSPHLKLLKPSPRVLEVLKMSGYDMFLEIHKNLNEAVASFK
jgi:anti-anti-sigma regulatory factor